MDLDTYRMLLQGGFQCTRCGTCCKICYPVDVDEEDIRSLAKHFKIPYQRAVRKFTMTHPEAALHRRILKQSRPCKFYDPGAGECKVYEARPKMCRRYPFLSPQQLCLSGIGLYTDCPGMALTLEVFKQYNEIHSKEFQKFNNYFDNHPEALELIQKFIQYASNYTIFGKDNIDAGKQIAEKLKPHLLALRAESCQ